MNVNRPKRAGRMFLFLVVFHLAGIYALRYLVPREAFPMWVWMMMGEIMLLVPALIVMLVRRESPFRVFPFRLLPVSSLLLLLAYAICLMPGVSLLNMLSMLVAPNAAADAMGTVLGYPLPAALMMIAVAPAVVEETMFRGMLYGDLRRERIWPAVFLSGVFFGVMHMNFNQFCYATAMGIAFALLAEATGTILAPMLVHAFYNGQSTVLAWILEKASGEVPAGIGEGQTLIDYIREAMNEAGAGTDGAAVVTGFVVSAILLLALAFVGIALARVILLALARRAGRGAHMAVLFKKEERRRLDAMRTPAPRSVWTWEAAAAVVIGGAYILLDTIFPGLL
ncbi:MAG: CPBP family intramembrane metalloprotease [Lachnospiraceae bacterium]|nr:CPBP family intramembrane metalloprotease [Lachnospiraceae bacterium]